MLDRNLKREVGSQQHGQSTLDRSELQFRQLLEKLPAGAYTCDADGLITYYNQHAVQLWGRAPELNEAVDRFCGSFKLFSPDGSPIAHDQCWMALALQSGQEYNGRELIVERPDGSRLTVLAHANPIRDESGKLVGAVNVLVDITDRKRAEDAQTLLSAIVESSEDAIIAKTLDGRIRSWNAGAERLFGYTAEEMVGSPITRIIPPDRLDEERAILARLRRGERIEHYETVRVAKGGRLIDVSLAISPVRDRAGRIVGASKVARDITARKQSEQALVALKDELASQLDDMGRLHEMSMRLSTTLQLEPILEETLRAAAAIEGTDMALLLLWDQEQNYLQVGASLGFSQDFIKAVDGIAPGGGAYGTCLQERRRVVVEDGESDPLFAPYWEAARRAGFRAVHSTPLVTRLGKTVGVLSTHFRQPHRPSERETRLIDLCARQAVDFIENARLYGELREADSHKDDFLAMLAHELRNPLAPITNSLQILRLSDDPSPAIERVREVMERQVNHMVRLVDDLLEVSRIRRGKIELRKEPVELAGILANAVETSRPLIDDCGHQLAITLPPEPIALEADPVRLSQVIANLLNNAAKYTEEGGQIWLTARREHDQAVVSIRDTGLGISADMLGKIFEMFTQVDGSLERSKGGLGIGLSLVRAIVEMHHGTIEARSDGPGRGSEFIVRLPTAVERKLQVQPAAGDGAPACTAFKGRILVVDDNEDSAATLGMMLRMLGNDVSTAHDGLEAVEAAAAFRPDIVFLDIGLPRMNGYDAARKLREQSWGKTMYLIALTGWGHDEDRRRSAEAGFNHHLVKPVDFAALESVLAGFRGAPAQGPSDARVS